MVVVEWLLLDGHYFYWIAVVFNDFSLIFGWIDRNSISFIISFTPIIWVKGGDDFVWVLISWAGIGGVVGNSSCLMEVEVVW